MRAKPHKGWYVSLVKCQRTLAGSEADQVKGTCNKNGKNGYYKSVIYEDLRYPIPLNSPGFAFMARVLQTSSGWVRVVAIAPCEVMIELANTIC